MVGLGWVTILLAIGASGRKVDGSGHTQKVDPWTYLLNGCIDDDDDDDDDNDSAADGGGGVVWGECVHAMNNK